MIRSWPFVLLLGCASAPHRSSALDFLPRCSEASHTVGNSCAIVETTQSQFAGHDVGVSNIYERRIATPDRTAARLSASVSVYDLVTKTEEHHIVIAGSTFNVGKESYRVRNVEAVPNTPGWIVLEKLPNQP
jgi:hypothetical protein